MHYGLTEKEAQELLIKNGENSLKEKKPKTMLQLFLEQFLNITTLIFLVAIIISIILGDISDAFIIGAVLILNAVVGVVQEGKAQKALEALKQMSILKAVVIRDGKKQEIDSKYLVVGDIVEIEAGRQVPADLKLIETNNLQIIESALTGESVPVNKDSNAIVKENTSIGDRFNEAFMSTEVSYGRGLGIVTNTGMNTEIGKIATLLNNSKDEQTPLQVRMADLSKFLGILVVVLCVLLYFIALIQKRDIMEMLMTAVSLAVAAIPEGLPAIVTVVLALGVQRMAKSNAIVRRLPSVETLGSVKIVCSDKTGTLTQNKMTVVKAFKDNKIIDLNNLETSPNDLFVNGFMLCNDSIVSSDKEIGDPTETALVRFALNYGLDKNILEKTNKRINELPFDSDRKLMTTVNLFGEKIYSFTKGSTDELIKRCTKILIDGKIRDITQNDIDLIMDVMGKMSEDALRVLSLAIRENNEQAIEQNLTYIGMIGMIDPEREEVKASIDTFKKANIKTVMITGDHKITALAIAKRLGIANNMSECIMGDELDNLSDEELIKIVPNLSVFARVSPEHKVRIVKAYQANGNIVSMTGDGVNDSPSLKQADVGVAMGITGTDVAKGAADIVLCDDKFTTIEKAIKGGRSIYADIKKSITFALSSNFGEVITMFLAIILGLTTPLKATHILWVNLLTDSLPCLGLGVDTNDETELMSKPPRDKNESLFAGGALFRIIFYGAIIALITLSGFLFLPIKELILSAKQVSISNIVNTFNTNENILIKSQTYAFCILAVSQLFHAIGMRDYEKSIFKMNHFENKIMVIAFCFGLFCQILVTEIPFLTSLFGTIELSFVEWIYLILISTIPIVFHEIFVFINLLKNKLTKKAL